jgi:hypothetical protein
MKLTLEVDAENFLLEVLPGPRVEQLMIIRKAIRQLNSRLLTLQLLDCSHEKRRTAREKQKSDAISRLSNRHRRRTKYA